MNRATEVDNAVQGYTSAEKVKPSIPHISEPYVVIAAVLMNPLGVNTVYTSLHIKKRGLERTNSEIWQPRPQANIDDICQTILLKSAAYLPNYGTVLYTLPGLQTVNVLARGKIEFIPITKQENPVYQAADQLATDHWLEVYK